MLNMKPKNMSVVDDMEIIQNNNIMLISHANHQKINLHVRLLFLYGCLVTPI